MTEEELNMLVNLAAVDHSISEEEEKIIRIIAKVGGMTESHVNDALKNPTPVKNMSLTVNQKLEYIYLLVQVMKVDGKVFKSEIDFCQKMAEKMGFKKKVVSVLSSYIYRDPSVTADRDTVMKKAKKFLA